MGLLTRSLATSMLGLTLASGCTLSDHAYPPALPATPSGSIRMPWDNRTSFLLENPPPAELQWKPAALQTNPASRLVPGADEWATWKPYVPPKVTCTGKGKRRSCTTTPATVVDQANVSAVIKPKAVHMLNGASAQVHYPLDLRSQMQVFEIHTSPFEFTKLLLPREERLATKLTLNPDEWEVIYGKTGAEGARQEVIAIRPTKAPQKGREVVLLQSGLSLYLQLVAREQVGMLAVTWEMPEPTPPPVPDIPLDRRPPVFHSADAYSGYTVKLGGKYQPPWYPKVIVDDARNTMIQFGTSLDGQRMPVVTGVQQNGTPAIVASRLYTHPEHPEWGAWLYVQGLHPALQLKDAAGLAVTITRQVPNAPTGGSAYAER